MALSRQQISAIAHADHPIACPFSDARVDQLLEFLPKQGQVLDVGCGGGEWIARLLASRPALHVTGVDASNTAIARARNRLVGHNARLVVQDAETFLEAPIGPYDAVMCNGSTHALGGLMPALARLRGLLGPGGVLLISDGYWQRPPSEAACRALHAGPDDFRSLEATVALAKSAGYVPVHVATSDPDEWDDYERHWCDTLEGYAAEHPDLPVADLELIASTARSHRDAYWNGYRGTLGFAAFLLQAAEQRERTSGT